MHSLHSRLKALASSLLISAGLAGSVRAEGGSAAVQVFDDKAVSGAARLDLSERISLDAEFSSADTTYARGVLRAHDVVVGGGVLSDAVVGHAGYDSRAVWEGEYVDVGFRGRLVGGFGADPFGEGVEIGAASGGVRFELASRGNDWFCARGGVYAEALAAVPVRLFDEPRARNGFGRALALSEDRLGVFGDVSLRLVNGPISLEASLREIYEVVHGDVGVWLSDVFKGDAVEGDVWSGRLISRAQLAARFELPRNRNVLVGGFAQHVWNGSFYDDALFRNGWSFGVIARAEIPPFQAWVEARWYAKSELADFGDDVRASGMAGVEFLIDGKYASARFVAGAGLNSQRSPDTGFLANDFVGFVGLGLEFGARSSVRSELLDYARRSAQYGVQQTRSVGGGRQVAQSVQGWQNEDVAGLTKMFDPTLLSDVEKESLLNLVDNSASVEDVQSAIQNDPVIQGVYARALDIVQKYAAKNGLALPPLDLLRGPVLTAYGRRVEVHALPARKVAVLAREERDDASLEAALAREEDRSGDAVEQVLTYDGLSIGVSSTRDLARVMRGAGRGVLQIGGERYVIRAPWAEAYGRLLGAESLSDDIRLPFYGWRR